MILRNRSKARDGVCDRSIGRDFKYSFGSHPAFLLQAGGERPRHRSQPRIS